MNLKALLEHCEPLAVQAGQAVMEIYTTDFDVQQKADASPLTAADIAANRIITTALKKLAPELPCLSEEGPEIAFAERSQWRRYWLIDPLDGTKEFVKRNGDFTINIALIEDGIPILGVVFAPVPDVLYAAARGVGAWRVEGGVHMAIHSRQVPDRPVVVASKSHRKPELERLLNALPEHEATSRGSSLKFCLVAEGTADCYPRTGPTSEWDTGAGQCVAEQAGCQVLTLPDWQPLRYNTKTALINPGFAVIGDPDYGWLQHLNCSRAP